MEAAHAAAGVTASPPGSTRWFEYLRIVGVPPDFLGGADPAAYHVRIARLDGENVAAAMAEACTPPWASATSRILEYAPR